MNHVAKQPVAVEIEADTLIFQYYSSGIIDDQGCGFYAYHKAVIIGYGMKNNKRYWILKNNWGTKWG